MRISKVLDDRHRQPAADVASTSESPGELAAQCKGDYMKRGGTGVAEEDVATQVGAESRQRLQQSVTWHEWQRFST